jgi:hypothetical protein
MMDSETPLSEFPKNEIALVTGNHLAVFSDINSEFNLPTQI